MIDQSIQGLVEQTGPSMLSYLMLALPMMAGYFFIAFKDKLIPKLKPAPTVDRSSMTFFQRVKSFGRASTHELSDEEWASIRQCRRYAVPLIIGFSVLIGFFSSTFGMVWMLWALIATAGGALVRHYSDKRFEG